jgi:hypothetical protein
LARTAAQKITALRKWGRDSAKLATLPNTGGAAAAAATGDGRELELMD